jgi:ABC-type spermidine/putrescine transport system permease subunit II
MSVPQSPPPQKVRFPITPVAAGLLSLPFWYWRMVKQGVDPGIALWVIVISAIIGALAVYVGWRLALKRHRP